LESSVIYSLWNYPNILYQYLRAANCPEMMRFVPRHILHTEFTG